MAREIFPSSYRCDCGHRCDFFENTVRQAKQKSMQRRVRLSDAEPDPHTIVFDKGKMVEIECPNSNRAFSNDFTDRDDDILAD